MKRSKQNTSDEHIRGLTVFAALSELDPALVAEAEVATAHTAATAEEHTANAHREADTRDEVGTPPADRFFTIDEPSRRSRTASPARKRAWGIVAASLAAVLVLTGVVGLMGRWGGGLLPGGLFPGGMLEPSDSQPQPSDHPPVYTAADILLAGNVPFAPQAGNYTLSMAPPIPDNDRILGVTMNAKDPSVPFTDAERWELESLTSPPWSISLLDMSVLASSSFIPSDRTYAKKTATFGLFEPLSPGLYRLHAMKSGEDGTFRSVAFCEFAVDDDRGTYKTWTNADMRTGSTEDVGYTISTDAAIPYGTSAISVTFRATKPMTGFSAPETCRLVKSDGAAGAGACLVNRNEGTRFGVEIDAAPGSNTTASRTVTYTILNPAACTPGRYCLYNTDETGAILAACEFEIVGEPLKWPGEGADDAAGEDTGFAGAHPFPEAAEKPYTIQAEFRPSQTDPKIVRLHITYKGTVKGQVAYPCLTGIVLHKISGAADELQPHISMEEYGLEPITPAADAYFLMKDDRRIINQAYMTPGVYRVYSLNAAGTAYIDYCDVAYEGPERTAVMESTADAVPPLDPASGY